MRIQFRQYDGKGDMDDPSTGTPISATPQSVLALLSGKSVWGVGGVGPNTESIVFNFKGMNVWFVTTKDVPRIIFQKFEL